MIRVDCDLVVELFFIAAPYVEIFQSHYISLVRKSITFKTRGIHN
jgi:hypothetical protein